jgi:hypothetical protein
MAEEGGPLTCAPIFAGRPITGHLSATLVTRPHAHNMAAQNDARADTRLGKGSPISINRMNPEQTNDGTTTSKFGLSMEHARRRSLKGRVVFSLVLRRWLARSVPFVASVWDRPIGSFRRTANEHKVLFAP